MKPRTGKAKPVRVQPVRITPRPGRSETKQAETPVATEHAARIGTDSAHDIDVGFALLFRNKLAERGDVVTAEEYLRHRTRKVAKRDRPMWKYRNNRNEHTAVVLDLDRVGEHRMTELLNALRTGGTQCIVTESSSSLRHERRLHLVFPIVPCVLNSSKMKALVSELEDVYRLHGMIDPVSYGVNTKWFAGMILEVVAGDVLSYMERDNDDTAKDLRLWVAEAFAESQGLKLNHGLRVMKTVKCGDHYNGRDHDAQHVYNPVSGVVRRKCFSTKCGWSTITERKVDLVAGLRVLARSGSNTVLGYENVDDVYWVVHGSRYRWSEIARLLIEMKCDKKAVYTAMFRVADEFAPKPSVLACVKNTAEIRASVVAALRRALQRSTLRQQDFVACIGDANAEVYWTRGFTPVLGDCAVMTNRTWPRPLSDCLDQSEVDALGYAAYNTRQFFARYGRLTPAVVVNVSQRPDVATRRLVRQRVMIALTRGCVVFVNVESGAWGTAFAIADVAARYGFARGDVRQMRARRIREILHARGMTLQ